MRHHHHPDHPVISDDLRNDFGGEEIPPSATFLYEMYATVKVVGELICSVNKLNKQTKKTTNKFME